MIMLSLFGNKCLAYSFYIFTITAFVTFSEAKPTSSGKVNAGESGAAPFSPRLLVREVHPSPRIVISEPHPVQRSEHSQARAAEGVWQGSARLPSSAKSGGNEHSRYNIRRDGSLSIALQGSSSSSSNTANKPIEQSNPKFPNPLPSYFQSQFNNGWNRKDRKITPTELRSFSVVLSDVDVIGTYGQTRSDQQQHPDSYSQAGVTSYRLNSNSIHRMNASWKLNPNKTQVDSDQLLHFLSLFSSDAAKKQEQPSHDEDEDDLEEEESRRQQNKATRHEDTQPNGDNDRDHQLNYSSNSSSDINSLPFSTWSETSRQLLSDRNHNETIPSNHSGTATTGGSRNNNSSISNSNGKSQSQVVLHDLILTLGKLMETKNPENNTSSSATDKKETRRGTASTTDPQQTAADLKKLMSLLLRSDEPSGGLSSTKDGAQVVNIVITPGSNSSDDKQKILFLKSHQIQQLLQGAMTDPNLKHVVSKIASALRTPPQSVHKRNSNSNFYDNLYDSAPSPAACSSCIPQEDVEDLLSPNQGPMTGLNPHLTTSSTPDGFPLTGNGFLNLNHPNLQFHQALHHLVANGSTPTTINATTKTNVINIFVLNFNSASTPSVANITKVMTEGKPIVEAGTEEENDDYVLPLRPPVVYSLNNYKPGGIITKHDLVQNPSPRPNLQSQALFFNKMGMPGQMEEEDTEESLEADMDRVINSQSRPQRFKPFIEVTSSHGNPYVAITPASTTTTSTDRINILNLLPNHANSFTPVQKFGEGTRVRPSEYSNPIHHDDPESLDHEAAELFSYLMKAEKETFQGASSTPAASTPPTPTTTEEPSSLLPPEFAHLSWILKQEPPPKPNVGPSSTVSASHGPKNKLGNKNPTQFYDEEYDSDESDSGESEPSFLQPPNFNFNKRFGISHKPSQLLSSSSPPTIDPRPLYEQILSSSVLNFTVPPSATKNPSETKSKGTPTPLTTTTFKPRPNSNKRRPIQLFSPGDKENTKQRVRKLMTALGYSALPTLAAGAVATWPYWVPIVATGRRKRRSHSLIQSMPYTWTPTTSLAPKSDKRPAVTKELVEDQLFPQLPKEPIESKVGAEPKMESGPRGRGIEAETEAVGRREGAGAPADSSREKWIRVEVITESSSPTLRTAENRKSTLGSVMTDNNRQFLNGEPQDVPLLKNFLKNVLSNEWNISTTTAPLTTSTTQQEPNSHSTPTPTPVLNSAGQIRPRPSGSSGTRTPSYAAFAQDEEDSDAQRPNNSPFYASQSLINPSKSKPILLPASEQAVKSPIMLPSRNNSQQRPNQAQHPVIGSINDDLERQRRQRLRQRLAANIREAETAYASAAVLPLWFPILLGNGLKTFTDTDQLESYSQFQ